MDFGRVIKWAVILGLVVAVWKVGVPWVKRQSFGGSAASVSGGGASGDPVCVRAAERASEVWGSGLGRFVNPPYDLAAWSSFRGDVDARIQDAESQCSCAEESCRKARSAMSDLRMLVSEMDTAIRTGGSPPSDAVQRQERIDSQINEAAGRAF